MELGRGEALLKKVLSRERLLHSLGVMKSAGQLAALYGEDPEKARLAGLLHDYGKQFSPEELGEKARELGVPVGMVEEKQPDLLHAPVGACLVSRELGIRDRDIIQAISCHTTGKPGMGRLSRIVFLADYIEENRSFPGVQELRGLACRDLDAAVLGALDGTIGYVIQRKWLLHPDTVHFRNQVLLGLE